MGKAEDQIEYERKRSPEEAAAPKDKTDIGYDEVVQGVPAPAAPDAETGGVPPATPDEDPRSEFERIDERESEGARNDVRRRDRSAS